MSAPILTSEPASIRAGDTAAWLLTLADYPASSGWSVQYTLVNSAGKITIGSSASGSNHQISVAPAVTAAWTPGSYAWQRRVTNGTEAYTTATGSIDVLPDFSSAISLDARTHAKKTLDALEAWIESRDPGVAEYEIAGRRMKYISITELLKLRDRYRREVRSQTGQSGRVYMRF